MATLAAACAENEGLRLVTEFPSLHGRLLGAPRDKILTACLEGAKSSGQTSGQKIAEFIIYRHCNVDMLSAEGIVALKNERDALVDFRAKLETLAKTLPPIIHSEKHLHEYIEDLLGDLFKEWRKDQKNLSPVARRFFGKGMSSEIRRVSEKMVEGVFEGSVGHILTVVGAGFAIALVFRAYDSWRETRNAAKESPLRYLTKLQDQGVLFSFAANSPSTP
jgi:hypothetical protein